jgi:hypothetical protein
MTASAALRTIRDMRRILGGAVDQAKLGYEFSPNSFSYGALSACLAAEQALAVLSDALSEEERGQEARPRPQKSRL